MAFIGVTQPNPVLVTFVSYFIKILFSKSSVKLWSYFQFLASCYNEDMDLSQFNLQ